ncbi:lysophospholipid acyltransferase family protein [uncultured Piscinibacter sp.]|uniref:lysophospholipid acyltransferase family protein n=1 Tax=uncultured Piscinibacter sp. TaxID=1131835 RepID=UPI00261AF8C1|nr:lysophospholipid acyltransferase family protein [uncultured Piscinibacter sp.]
MPVTIFDTPLLVPLLRTVSRLGLRLAGWRVEGAPAPHAPRCVVIAAPHTSNWDLPFTLMGAFALGMNIRWLGKASLFRPPFGTLMRWLGGIPVQRDRANQLVASSITALKAAPGPLQLVLSPEGTRSRRSQWKTGFHHIARGAGLPIQLAYLDYGQRRLGLGPLIEPGDDLDADLVRIRAFYAPMRGLNAGQFDAG